MPTGKIVSNAPDLQPKVTTPSDEAKVVSHHMNNCCRWNYDIFGMYMRWFIKLVLPALRLLMMVRMWRVGKGRRRMIVRVMRTMFRFTLEKYKRRHLLPMGEHPTMEGCPSQLEVSTSV